MKKTVFAMLVVMTAMSTAAFAGSEDYFYGPAVGTSSPSANVADQTGSENATVNAPQQLNVQKLDCVNNGTDGSGQVLLVCQTGGNN